MAIAVQEQSRHAEQEAVPYERLLFPEVRRRYMKYFENNPEFECQLDMDAFKKYFAEAAHELGIRHRENRQQYNLFFGLVRKKLSDWLKREKKRREAKNAGTPPPCQAANCICEPAQPDLFRGNSRPLPKLPVSPEPTQAPLSPLPAHERIQLNLFGEPNPRLVTMEYAKHLKAEMKNKNSRPVVRRTTT